MLKLIDNEKKLQLYAENVCLSGPMNLGENVDVTEKLLKYLQFYAQNFVYLNLWLEPN